MEYVKNQFAKVTLEGSILHLDNYTVTFLNSRKLYVFLTKNNIGQSK